MNIAYEAMMFAREAHKTQRRRYTNNLYADHLPEVAGIVATVDSDPEAIAVAWLHDCIEDQGASEGEIRERFGPRVAHGVLMLSDLETGNRAARKAGARARLALAEGWVQTIKVADLISNTGSIASTIRTLRASTVQKTFGTSTMASLPLQQRLPKSPSEATPRSQVSSSAPDSAF